MKLEKLKLNWVPIVGWTVTFVLLYLYRHAYSLDHNLSSDIAFSLFDLLIIIACSFLINKYLIPKFLYSKKILSFIFLLLVLITFFSNAILGFQWIWYKLIEVPPVTCAFDLLLDIYYQFYDSYILIIVGCLLIVAFRLIKDQLLAQGRYALLEKEKAQTELSFLKAQINPHFLFNSINTIFAHIDKTNKEAREMLLTFSEMLRYQLYECNTDKIEFSKELTYLNNYIELQRIRKEKNLEVKIELNGDLKDLEIAPLLFIPFIENAFKYVSNYNDKINIIKIELASSSGYLRFYCMNTKDKITSRNIFEEHGIGINNTKRRLELLYPGKHNLLITEDETSFEVLLKIEIA